MKKKQRVYKWALQITTAELFDDVDDINYGAWDDTPITDDDIQFLPGFGGIRANEGNDKEGW